MKTCFTLIILAIILFISPTFAQENISVEVEKSTSPLEISGSVDTYYTYDFSGNDNIPTSFADNRNTVAIGMLDVALTKSFKKVSFTGEFSFGPRSFKSITTFDPDNTGSGSNIWIQNLYISYAVTNKLSLTAGYMGTFVGYEVISPAGNFNYSTSYLFTSGPFQNAGLKANYAFSNRFAIMVGVFNDWNVYSDANGVSDLGAQVFIAPIDGWDVYLNFINGYTTGTVFDITTGFQLTHALYIGMNAADFSYATKNDGGYSGVALYPQYAVSDLFSIGLRSEFFSTKDVKDSNETVTTPGGSVVATTITASFSIDGFTFITEARLDSSDDVGFIDSNSIATSSASQVTLAAIFAF